jgi:hypothetical protein
MIDQDDVRFTSFTRDLARRHRRPRSFPVSPTRTDALEQLCGGGSVAIAAAESAALGWTEGFSDLELPDLADDDDSNTAPS